jgi:hypothetical protein
LINEHGLCIHDTLLLEEGAQMTTPVQSLVGGQRRDGRGDARTSVNPARPVGGRLRVVRAIGERAACAPHVNSETAGAGPRVPFGGVKDSGAGPKEQGRAAREFFTETTAVYLRAGA